MDNTEKYAMLDLMIQPGFCVEAGRIVKVNAAGESLLLAEGMELIPMLLTGSEEYAAFQSGCLYLQLDVGGVSRGASVTRMGDTDIFLLEEDEDLSSLRSLSLAARELRSPLSDLIAITENLLPHSLPAEDPKSGELLARMSRELYRLQRTLGNMSDVGQISAMSHFQTRNLAQIFDDIFEKAGALLEQAGIPLTYKGLPRDVYGLIDDRQMERAVLNILSNAAKFSQPGETIQVSLRENGASLQLTIADHGSGLGDSGLGTLHKRYLRQPGLEDRRYGLGLGMVLIRSVAASHGGTVLVSQPLRGGTQVTMTMKIRKNAEASLRCPFTDLQGGRDQALIELSEILPPGIYQKEL